MENCNLNPNAHLLIHVPAYSGAVDLQAFLRPCGEPGRRHLAYVLSQNQFGSRHCSLPIHPRRCRSGSRSRGGLGLSGSSPVS